MSTFEKSEQSRELVVLQNLPRQVLEKDAFFFPVDVERDPHQVIFAEQHGWCVSAGFQVAHSGTLISVDPPSPCESGTRANAKSSGST